VADEPNKEKKKARRKSGSVLMYGPSGVGKTTSACHMFKKSFVLLSEPDGLASVEANLGFMPDHHVLKDLDDPYAEARGVIVKKVRKRMISGQYSCCILDTGSELASRIFAALQLSENVVDGRKLYPKVEMLFHDLVRRLQVLPGWFVMICHEDAPKAIEGDYLKGGPRFPGRGLTASTPPMFSLVLRADWDHTGEEMRRCFYCDENDVDWTTKDRYGVSYRVQDMDLRPMILRHMYPGRPLPEMKPKPVLHPEGYEDQRAEEGAEI